MLTPVTDSKEHSSSNKNIELILLSEQVSVIIVSTHIPCTLRRTLDVHDVAVFRRELQPLMIMTMGSMDTWSRCHRTVSLQLCDRSCSSWNYSNTFTVSELALTLRSITEYLRRWTALFRRHQHNVTRWAMYRLRDTWSRRFTSMFSIHLQSCISKIMKIHAHL